MVCTSCLHSLRYRFLIARTRCVPASRCCAPGSRAPLCIDLGSTFQGEAIEHLVGPEVGEHRLLDGEASGDHLATLVGVDLALHSISRRFLGVGKRSANAAKLRMAEAYV